MRFPELRQELYEYYEHTLPARYEQYNADCTAKLDAQYSEELSVYELKLLQYRTILKCFTPVVFRYAPFYFSTGTLTGREHRSPTARWAYRKKEHLFWEQDAELSRLRKAQGSENLYLICSGPFNDTAAHFSFYYRPVLQKGLKGVYEEAKAAQIGASEKEAAYLNTVCEVLLTVRAAAERFAERAEELAQGSSDKESRLHYENVARTAHRIPWERPETMYEAFCMYLFIKEMLEGFEGITSNSFGRVDLDLLDLYHHDLAAGILTEDSAYDLICQFMLCSDCRYDHDTTMEAPCDHELENTLVLGGCDADGKPVWNELTRMFLRVSCEEKTIYPKIFCRYSSASPAEYLDEVNRAILEGTSTVLFQNDDAVIPAFQRAGRPLDICRDYLVAGCWDILGNGVERIDSAPYFNMVATLEMAVHRQEKRMEKVGIHFLPLDEAKDFEELYTIVVGNIRRLMIERFRISHAGGQIRDKVEILPLLSSTLNDCLKNRRDFNEGGSRYHDEKIFCIGLPNIIDSLMAMKTLCFDTKKYTLSEYLDAVRGNWEGHEDMRLAATRCHGWGDGEEDSSSLAARFNNDLYAMTQAISPTTYGGKVFLGYLAFTEIRFWGERTLATPDGRKSGDFLAHGLTPSRLKHIPSSLSVIESLSSLDPTTLAGNSVVNVILPAAKMNPDIVRAFLYAGTGTALESLQLNCFTKEQLLDAQKHPENYRNLIVRVTGFSARFTSLSPVWQNEVLTRNFYEN